MASLIKSSPDSPRPAMGDESTSEECWLDLKALILALRFTSLLGLSPYYLLASFGDHCFTFEGSTQV